MTMGTEASTGRSASLNGRRRGTDLPILSLQSQALNTSCLLCFCCSGIQQACSADSAFSSGCCLRGDRFSMFRQTCSSSLDYGRGLVRVDINS